MRRRRGPSTISDADSAELVEFAQAFANLGTSVQEQLLAILDGNYDDVHPNAVDVMRDFVSGFNEEIDMAIEDYDIHSSASFDDDKFSAS